MYYLWISVGHVIEIELVNKNVYTGNCYVCVFNKVSGLLASDFLSNVFGIQKAAFQLHDSLSDSVNMTVK